MRIEQIIAKLCHAPDLFAMFAMALIGGMAHPPGDGVGIVRPLNDPAHQLFNPFGLALHRTGQRRQPGAQAYGFYGGDRIMLVQAGGEGR